MSGCDGRLQVPVSVRGCLGVSVKLWLCVVEVGDFGRLCPW